VQLPNVLGHRLAAPAAGVAVVVELVLDKMAFTGSRLEPAGLAGRVVFAGVAGALVAPDRSVVPAAVVAIAAAVLQRKFAHDLALVLLSTCRTVAVAVVEDLAALGTAFAGCRLWEQRCACYLREVICRDDMSGWRLFPKPDPSLLVLSSLAGGRSSATRS